MTLLALLLAIDAALHALLVYSFGIKENMSFFVYVFIYAALAVAVLLETFEYSNLSRMEPDEILAIRRKLL
jgi:hypothetical protein